MKAEVTSRLRLFFFIALRVKPSRYFSKVCTKLDLDSYPTVMGSVFFTPLVRVSPELIYKSEALVLYWTSEEY